MNEQLLKYPHEVYTETSQSCQEDEKFECFDRDMLGGVFNANSGVIDVVQKVRIFW